MQLRDQMHLLGDRFDSGLQDWGCAYGFCFGCAYACNDECISLQGFCSGFAYAWDFYFSWSFC